MQEEQRTIVYIRRLVGELERLMQMEQSGELSPAESEVLRNLCINLLQMYYK
ncbi:MAG TPA: hypothetical protein VFH39_04530 [Candidatus Saccharimonadales bacterium]|nr:hypothetical protein [Candidatus Saccharimonadales bacterium]